MLNLNLNLNLGTPSHTTILNWVKKQGIGNFKEKDYFENTKWVLILDESVQFGNNKLLFATLAPITTPFHERYATYNDLIPLVLKSSTSWKSEDIIVEISKRINIKQIAYAVADNGNNIVKSLRELNVTHIEDINHKFSLIMEKALANNEDFVSYTKTLASMRTRLPLSKLAHITPPKQRTVSRYMNLEPILSWGVKMLELLESERLTDAERKALEFLYVLKDFVKSVHALVFALNQIQERMKNSGFNKSNADWALESLKPFAQGKLQLVSAMIEVYFQDTLSKMKEYDNVLCSSDIIESCFSKYKSISKENKSVGISDLTLCLSAMLGEDFSKIKENFEQVQMKDVNEWRKVNIGKTLFAQKREFVKKVG